MGYGDTADRGKHAVENAHHFAHRDVPGAFGKQQSPFSTGQCGHPTVLFQVKNDLLEETIGNVIDGGKSANGNLSFLFLNGQIA